jgi:hypothetical protein
VKSIRTGTILCFVALGSCSIGAGIGNPVDGFMMFGIGLLGIVFLRFLIGNQR